MWFFKLIESFFKRERGEQGSGLMTVLGVSLVVTIAAGTITSSIVMASNLTSEKLSQQQADAAAEAGIADAVHSYQTGNCVASSPMHDSPKYKYNFYRSNSENYPTTSGSSGTYAGCPGDSGEGSGSKADRWVMIESTGYGKNNTSKEKTAVFKIEPASMSVVPQAMTSDNIAIVGKSVVQKAQGVVGSPVLFSKNGVLCTKNAIINANVKYNSIWDWGLYEGGEGCTINGDLDVELNKKSDLNIEKLNINGDVCSNRPISKSSVNIKGDQYSNNENCDASGTYYGYVPDMSDSIKFSTDKGNKECSSWNNFSKWIKLISEKNKIVDLTECKGIENILKDDSSTKQRPLEINSNLTLVFKDIFDISKIDIITTQKNSYNLNFVIASDTADASDSTSKVSSTSVIKNVNYKEGTSGFIYVPGAVWILDSTINGQIYGKGTISLGNPLLTSENPTTLNYTPVGLPNAEKKIKDIGRVPDLIRVY